VSDTATKPAVHDIYKRVLEYDRRETKYMIELPAETVLSLARTCKALTQQVNSIYYGSNTFELNTSSTLYKFLAMIGPTNRRYIRSIAFDWMGDYNKEAFEMLGRCVFLENLTCRVSPSSIVPRWELSKNLNHLRYIKIIEKLRVRDPSKFKIVFESCMVTWFRATRENPVQLFDDRALTTIAKRLQKAITSGRAEVRKVDVKNALPGQRFSRRLREKNKSFVRMMLRDAKGICGGYLGYFEDVWHITTIG
jgi:hypothetical protein